MTRRPLLGILAVAVAAALLSGCDEAGSPDAGATVTMTRDGHFAPAAVTVEVGDTVTWVNRSTRPHAATTRAVASGDRGPRHPWGTGMIAPGGVASIRFTVAGRFTYGCPSHAGEGMIGTLVVRPREG